jgi:DNA-binding transcriptional LysR family regulator
MDLVLLESLVSVADQGTITAAAGRLSVSQSALSRRLQQLESELNAVLLVRGRNGIELTSLGHATVIHAKSLLSRYEELCRDLSEQQGLTSGRLRVGGGATVTSFLLPRAIATFQRAHPGVRFYVKEGGSRDIAEKVGAGELDLGLVTLPVAQHGLSLQDLTRDEIVLVGRKDDPLAGKTARAGDLSGRAVIAFESGTAIRQVIDARLFGAGIKIDVTMELRSIPSILRMVATTGLLAFVSRMSLPSEPDLCIIPMRGVTIERTLALATRRDVPLSPAALAFAGTLFE